MERLRQYDANGEGLKPRALAHMRPRSIWAVEDARRRASSLHP